MEETEYSDSGFIVAGDVTALWQEIMLLQRRQHSALYRGKAVRALVYTERADQRTAATYQLPPAARAGVPSRHTVGAPKYSGYLLIGRSTGHRSVHRDGVSGRTDVRPLARNKAQQAETAACTDAIA